MKIEVFHNIETDINDRPIGRLDGYQPFHRVVRVFATDVPDPYDDLTLCEIIRQMLNVGDDQRTVEYRQRGNRSLCIGDLVKIDERRWYAVARLGFTQVTNRPDTSGATVDGSTMLPEESV
jgi:hypothetical protein